jgi:hypothetical protein
VGVLTCKVNGTEYALETPDQVGKVLANVAGFDVSRVAKVAINGRNAELTQLVGNGDEIIVKMAAETAGMITVKINGKKVVGTPADIRSILFSG